MLHNKCKKYFVILACVIFAVSAITTSIMLENQLHKKCCEHRNCLICNLIDIALQFNRNLTLANNQVAILIIIIPLLYKLFKQKNEIIKETPVELNIIQNE